MAHPPCHLPGLLNDELNKGGAEEQKRAAASHPSHRPMMTRRRENLAIALITKETKLYKHTRQSPHLNPTHPVPEVHRRRQRSGENDAESLYFLLKLVSEIQCYAGIFKVKSLFKLQLSDGMDHTRNALWSMAPLKNIIIVECRRTTL
jgi:hypothetical protein